MFMDLITHGYLFNQIMFINSITLSLYIYQITLCHLNFALSFIVFNHPGWGYLISVSFCNSSFIDC